MYSWWLSLHLGGAAITGLTVLATFMVIIVRRRQTYAPLAVTLSMLTGWQLISGAFLTLTAVETPTLFSYCRNILGYLTFVSVALLLLFRQMKLAGMAWPKRQVVPPLSFGMVVTAVTGIILYVS